MQFDETTQKRLLRMALLCHSEQLIDRVQLLQAIEQLQTLNADNVTEIAGRVLPQSMLDELDLRLSRVQSDVADLRGKAPSFNSAASYSASLGENQIDQRAFAADVLAEEDDQPVAWAGDLHVGMATRILWPVCGIGVCVLIYYVISTIIASPDLFKSNRDRDPSSSATSTKLPDELAAANDSNSDPLAPADTPETVPAITQVIKPRVSRVAARLKFETSLENFVANEQYDRAMDLLNSDGKAASTDLPLLEAAVLLAKGGAQSTDEALDLLVQPSFARTQNDDWLAAYANALIYASKPARERAIQAIENSSGRAKVRPDLRRVIEWAKARNGASNDELEELRMLASDFKATSRDHLFLAFSSIQSDQKSQVKYHISKAAQRLESEQRDVDSSLPEWLQEKSLATITKAINTIKQNVTPSAE